jgi:hypothetical protein
MATDRRIKQVQPVRIRPVRGMSNANRNDFASQLQRKLRFLSLLCKTIKPA